MTEADTTDTRVRAIQAAEARAEVVDFYRRLTPEDLRVQYETVREARSLHAVAVLALTGDPDAALARLESVPVQHLEGLHNAVIDLCSTIMKSREIFSVGGPGSVH